MLTWLFSFALVACAPTRPPNVSELDIPLRLPPVERFTFGPGDRLAIWVWRHEDLTVDVTVAPDGFITYPLLGRVEVAGQSYESLVKALQAGVDQYYVDAKVAVNIIEVTNEKVLVIGEVAKPQVIQIRNDLSVLEALTIAGGVSYTSNTRNVLVVRGGMETPTAFSVDIDAVYGRADFTQMVYLQRGDIVYVPATTITNVERYFRSLQAVLGPAVGASAVYRNLGGTQNSAAAGD